MDTNESKPDTGRTLFDNESAVPPPQPQVESAPPETDEIPEVSTTDAIETAPPAAGRGKLSTDSDATWAQLSGQSFGPALAEARRRVGMRIEQVIERTQIQRKHLEAIEQESYSDLPEVVYILAYVRKLARLYGMPQWLSDDITEELRQNLNREPPEDVSKIGFEPEENEENTRRVRQLLTGLIVAAAAIAILLIGSVAFLLTRTGGGSGRTVFDESQLLDLQPQPGLRVRPLAVPR